MATLLDKALSQRTEVTERHISKSKLQNKVTKLKAAIAQNESIGELLREELEMLLRGQQAKRPSKKEKIMQEYEQYFNSKSKK